MENGQCRGTYVLLLSTIKVGSKITIVNPLSSAKLDIISYTVVVLIEAGIGYPS
jgi:hypothetical protein